MRLTRGLAVLSRRENTAVAGPGQPADDAAVTSNSAYVNTALEGVGMRITVVSWNK